MRRLKNIYKLFTVITILLMIGCIQKPAVKDEAPAEEQIVKIEERGFDPLELSSDRKIIPFEHPQSGIITGQLISADTTYMANDSVYTNISNLPDEVDSLNHQAFRIQLYSSKVFGEAKYALKVAEEIFDRPLYLDYEVPYFKLRVGNFPTRDKAEDFQMRCKSAGYTDAWVVAVNINIKEASPLYDELILPDELDSIFYYEQTLEGEAEADEDNNNDQ